MWLALIYVVSISGLMELIAWRPNAMPYGTLFKFYFEDRWWIALHAVFLIMLALAWRRWPPSRGPHWSVPQLDRLAFSLAIVIGLATLAGTYVIQHDYDLVRDQLYATFDAAIFASGKLMAPVPSEWRDYLPALMARHVLPTAGNVAWVSSYLPGNAAFRALTGLLLAPQVANPLLAALSVLFCVKLGRRFWPDRSAPTLAALAFFTTSAQMLFMAMTSFANTGHMTFTLAWMLLFLRGDRIGHAGAIAVGFIATGWHQLLFHLLFVAPFVLELWWSRRWRLAAFYSGAYAVIALFWVSYWKIAASVQGVALAGGFEGGTSFFVQRVLGLLLDISPFGLATMVMNMLRMVAWNNPVLPVFIVIGLLAWRQLPRPLLLAAAGAGLTVLAMFVLLPYQGHGWGYRYLQGFIGPLCLIAGFGWMQIADGIGQARARVPLIAACLLSLIVILPLQAYQVRAYVGRHAAAFDVLLRQAADIVLVDDREMYYGEELVRNDPFLRNKPLFLHLPQLTPRLLRDLCARGHKLTLFDRDQAIPLNVAIPGAPLGDLPGGLTAAMATLPCLVPFNAK